MEKYLKSLSILLLLVLVLQPFNVVGYNISGSFLLIDGSNRAYSHYEGSPTLIEVVQSTCGACKDPDHRAIMNNLEDAYSDAINFLIISVRTADTVNDMIGFRNSFGIEWDVGIDTSGTAANALEIEFTPTISLIDEDGEVLEQWIGKNTQQSEYESAINEVVDPTDQVSPSPTINNDPGSWIGNLFGNPIFQFGLVLVLAVTIFLRASKRQ